jgi:histidine triad (HIT) family protein
MNHCTFCAIARLEAPSAAVYEDDIAFAFLDNRPLFPGHSLLIPKKHYETLGDLPDDVTPALFRDAKMLSQAVPAAMRAEGSFVAINNRISQSVPHLHIHIVPRRKGDGLKGFFWPRTKYKDAAEMEVTRELIARAIQTIHSAVLQQDKASLLPRT